MAPKMKQRFSAPVLVLLGLTFLLPVPSAMAESIHSNDMPILSMDTSFPRLSKEELVENGFPDHMHSYWWPSWKTLIDDDGTTYGPGSFCSRRQLIPREGLSVEPGRNSFGNFITLQNEAYRPCDMLPMLENLDWAYRDLSKLLGLVVNDTLTVVSPDNIPDYRAQTGLDIWRFYKLDGNSCIIEPYGTLQSRTLEGHAIFILVTDWLLHQGLPVDLPTWLHFGLTEYMGEDGVHLVNYMMEFRSHGSFLYSPALVNHILSQPPDLDLGKDRENFRRASYSAFLMVWELVENRGGLQAMREFLVLVSQCVEMEKASLKVYGLGLEELANSLDPVVLGEPIGDNTQSRKPAHPPQER